MAGISGSPREYGLRGRIHDWLHRVLVGHLIRYVVEIKSKPLIGFHGTLINHEAALLILAVTILVKLCVGLLLLASLPDQSLLPPLRLNDG